MENALFMADYARTTVRAMLKDTNGNPNPNTIIPVASGIYPVDLEMGPDKKLYSVNISKGEIDAISKPKGGNHSPTAVITADKVFDLFSVQNAAFPFFIDKIIHVHISNLLLGISVFIKYHINIKNF
jgi:hypothetical protein